MANGAVTVKDAGTRGEKMQQADGAVRVEAPSLSHAQALPSAPGPRAVPAAVRSARWRVRTSAPVVQPVPARWSLAELSGRLSEMSGTGAVAQLTMAFALVLEAQRRLEPVAWVTARRSTFYPPDAAESGVDLDALPVVFAPDAAGAARAAGRLARSAAFGLIVVDLVSAASLHGSRRAPARLAEVPVPLQSRLAGLAKRHDVAVLCLTEKATDAPSLGALVSLRCEAEREPAGEGRFLCRVRAIKDKRRGPGWSHAEVRRGPAGLC